MFRCCLLCRACSQGFELSSHRACCQRAWGSGRFHGAPARCTGMAFACGSVVICNCSSPHLRRVHASILQVLARLIRGYNFRFQPRSHGVDLVETLHVVLGVLDRLSSAGEPAALFGKLAHALKKLHAVLSAIHSASRPRTVSFQFSFVVPPAQCSSRNPTVRPPAPLLCLQSREGSR